MLPLGEYFRLKQRVLRLSAFNDHILEALKRQGFVPPVDKVALFVLFIVGSYLPALVATIFYEAFCKKPLPPRFDPASHVFNQPDAKEMGTILQTVTQIQATLSQMQSNGGTSQSSSKSEETERILTYTQDQLQTLV